MRACAGVCMRVRACECVRVYAYAYVHAHAYAFCFRKHFNIESQSYAYACAYVYSERNICSEYGKTFLFNLLTFQPYHEVKNSVL